MESNPLVSVIMATFNEKPNYIRESISSILNQTYRNLELIVLDDSTNESTIREIDSLASSDSRIRLIRKEKRMGFVPALNEGLRLAKGEYIARMDGDDYSYPDRFEHQIKYFNSNLEVDIIGGSMDIMDENSTIVSQRKYPLGGFALKLYSVIRDPIAHPTVMIRKKRFLSIFYDETFKRGEDLELWLRLRNQGAIIRNIDSILLKYRMISNMAQKRDTLHFKYAFLARSQNFNWRLAVFDVPALCISIIYRILPNSIMNLIYKIDKRRHT